MEKAKSSKMLFFFASRPSPPFSFSYLKGVFFKNLLSMFYYQYNFVIKTIMQYLLIDKNSSMVEAWEYYFKDEPNVVVKEGRERNQHNSKANGWSLFGLLLLLLLLL